VLRSGQTLAYALLASHNLSKAAWGALQKCATQVRLCSALCPSPLS
jgi:hypothetical protein